MNLQNPPFFLQNFFFFFPPRSPVCQPIPFFVPIHLIVLIIPIFRTISSTRLFANLAVLIRYHRPPTQTEMTQ